MHLSSNKGRKEKTRIGPSHSTDSITLVWAVSWTSWEQRRMELDPPHLDFMFDL